MIEVALVKTAEENTESLVVINELVLRACDIKRRMTFAGSGGVYQREA